MNVPRVYVEMCMGMRVGCIGNAARRILVVEDYTWRPGYMHEMHCTHTWNRLNTIEHVAPKAERGLACLKGRLPGVLDAAFAELQGQRGPGVALHQSDARVRAHRV